MTRNYKRNAVRPACTADTSRRSLERARHREIGHRFPARNAGDFLPHLALERRAAQFEPHAEAVFRIVQVAFDLAADLLRGAIERRKRCRAPWQVVDAVESAAVRADAQHGKRGRQARLIRFQHVRGLRYPGAARSDAWRNFCNAITPMTSAMPMKSNSGRGYTSMTPAMMS